ncbi:MAG: SCO family protein [Thiohalospira sp.]
MRRNWLTPALVLGLAAVAGAWLTTQLTDGPEHGGSAELDTDTLPRTVEPFELTFADGEPFTAESLEGGWHLVFFGYTHCPDVCPTTLQTLQRTMSELEERDAALPTVVFVSVDPERDDRAQLEEYAGFFREDFRAATGQREAIDDLTDQFGAVYHINRDEGEDYTVDHSAAIAAVGPEGRIRALLNPPHRPTEMADRLEGLMAEEGS